LLGLGPFDRVMVVGIAGGVGPSVGVGDVVIPDVVVDGTTGAEYRPAPIDAPPPRGTIVTSDDFIMEPARLEALIAQGVVAVDMETGSVAAVCAARGGPVVDGPGHQRPGRGRRCRDAGPGQRRRVTQRQGDRQVLRPPPGPYPVHTEGGAGVLLAAKNAATTAARACAELRP
jgi:hypothetical protein